MTQDSALRSTAETAYGLAGLRILAGLELPGLPRWSDGAAEGETVSVRYASVPESLPSGIAVPNGQRDGETLLLRFRRAGRFLLREGREILIDPHPWASHAEICTFLLGTVFGALCHQRGILPLHASAIRVADGCAAFGGKKHAGKSTLAAALARRGHQVFSDDVCFVRRVENAGLLVWPGIGRIRLMPDAVESLACHGPGVEREPNGPRKFRVPVPSLQALTGPIPLRGFYQLEAADKGDRTRFTRMRGAAAIELLIPNVYRFSLAKHLGCRPAIFAMCAAIAAGTPIYVFRRPMGFDRLDGVLEQLETHLRAANEERTGGRGLS